MIHELKIHHQWAERLLSRQKRAEVREHDRDYQAGDTLRFRCTLWVHGAECSCMSGHDYEITHVLTAADGLDPRYCVLSVEPVRYVTLSVGGDS